MQQTVEKAMGPVKDETPSGLSIRVLGSFELAVENGDSVELKNRKAQALLAYLALTQKPIPRQTLVALFWPEMAEQTAKNNLRTTLSLLKRHLSPYLTITTAAVAFNRRRPYFLDVESFQNRVTDAIATQSLPDLQAATALYRGEFLQGFHLRKTELFDEWLLQQREHLHIRMVGALETLVTLCLDQDEYHMGLAAGERLLALEPWSEGAHRQLMILLEKSGQREGALAQYERCCRILAEELGLEPTPETTALYAQIRAGRYVAKPTPLVVDRPSSTTAPTPLRHNLPRQLTSLIGRAEDIDGIRQLLHEESVALVTLVGEGGIGKTRLALAVAQAFADGAQPQPTTVAVHKHGEAAPFSDGIAYISFAGLAPNELLADQLVTATANALRLQLSGAEPLRQQLQDWLRPKAFLLVFDNVEHLLPQVADFLVVLLQQAPKLKILATSRHLLNLQGETIVRLTGLPTPSAHDAQTLSPAALLAYGSIALFVERARRVNRTFQLTAANQAALVQICTMVHGSPLAIELAATQTRKYSCRQILHQLQQSYQVLSTTERDLVPRHRSIRAMLDYSWQFLNPDTARILAACSIFRSPFDSAAVGEIIGAGPDSLFLLVDRSLLQLLPGDEERDQPSFAMHELIRQYATERLHQIQVQTEPAKADRLQSAHAHYYLTLLTKQSALFVHDLAALQRMQSKIEDLRTAWEWACTQGEWALLVTSVEPLYQFCNLLSLFHEAERCFSHAVTQLQQLAAQYDTLSPTYEHLIAQLMAYQIFFSERLDQTAAAETLAREALAIGQRLNDSAVQSNVYCTLSTVYGRRADWVRAQRAAEEAVTHAQAAASLPLQSTSLQNLGCAYLYSGDTERALAYLQRSLALHHTFANVAGGRNYHVEGFLYLDVGLAHQAAGDWMQARTYYQQGVELYRQMPIPMLGVYAFSYLSELHLWIGSFDQALADARMALAICRSMGSRTAEGTALSNLAYAQVQLGNWDAAEDACQTLMERIGPLGLTILRPFAFFIQGELRRSQGEWQAALTAYETAYQEYRATKQTARAVSTQAKIAKLWLQAGAIPKALAQIEAVLSAHKQRVQQRWLESTTEYWICYEVLAAAQDPRAAATLQQGYQQVQAQAERITDPSLRHAYLNQIPANRALLALADQWV